MVRQTRVIVGALKAFTEQKVKSLVLSCTAFLIEDTPRDTGWARVNWVPKIGGPADGPTGSPEAHSSAAQQAGLAVVAAGYKLEQGPVHITDNVPYIVSLNEGHSQQQPAGFVQRSVAKGVAEVESDSA